MPFGLKNASSVFQRLMNAIVADLTEYAGAYIDNLIIFSETFGDHIQHLKTFTKTTRNRLDIQTRKIVPCREQLLFLRPSSWGRLNSTIRS